jgi:hypothetical protein
MAYSRSTPPETSTLPPPPAAEPTKDRPWYYRWIPICLLMPVVFPFGVVLLLGHPRWSVTRKMVVLFVFGPFCLLNSLAFLGSMTANSRATTSRPAATSHR